MIRASVLALFALATAGMNSVLAAEPSAVSVACASDETSCNITLTFANNDQHMYQVVPDESSLFADTARVVFADSLEGGYNVSDVHVMHAIKFRTDYAESKLWAVAWIALDQENGTTTLDRAIFATKSHGFVEYQDGHLIRYKDRRLTSTQAGESDVVLTLPEGAPWLDNADNERMADLAAPETYLGNMGDIVKFFPGCYPNDLYVHNFQMNIILDYGVYQDQTANVGGSDSAKLSAALSALDYQFSIAKLVYQAQLNIRLQIKSVMVGKASDPSPISMSRQANTCLNAIQAHSSIVSWNSAHHSSFAAGYTMLLSNCFVGINGVSYVGGVCQTINDVGVAAFNWLVLAHELGHGFGMNHAFQNGVGKTGGIMDYGDPMYQGAVQFHPIYNKPEVCRFLTALGNRCQYFQQTGQITGNGAGGSSCGDGVLAPGEECECLDGSTSCSKCNNCQISDSSVQCSSSTFMFRTASMGQSAVAVSSASLASSECCVNNRIARPKTSCSGGKNTCSKDGKCVPVCTRVLGSTAQACGFDSTGCMMGCIWQDRCRFDMVYGASQAKVSNVPDGTVCQLSGGSQGTCSNGGCVGGASDQAPAPSPSSPVSTPAKGINCSIYRKRSKCPKAKGCAWCSGKCKAAPCTSGLKRGLEAEDEETEDAEDAEEEVDEEDAESELDIEPVVRVAATD